LLLVHARDASPNVGHPSINKNNHPFISSDMATGLVHNGRIQEFDVLCKKYETFSSCDSEILLRIFEAKGGDELEGIKDIWRLITKGLMAVAIGQRLADMRQLWLFRNTYRTLWVIDCREILGQVFFASTEEIWQRAAQRCSVINNKRGKIPLYELPPYEVWRFKIDTESPVVEKHNHEIYEVEKGTLLPWKYDGPQLPVLQREAVAEVITHLNEEEEVLHSNGYRHKKKPCRINRVNPNKSYDYWVDPDRVQQLCEKIRDISTDVETIISNDHHSFTYGEFDNITESLEQISNDLEGTLRLCER
jgi:hypothetical protein